MKKLIEMFAAILNVTLVVKNDLGGFEGRYFPLTTEIHVKDNGNYQSMLRVFWHEYCHHIQNDGKVCLPVIKQAPPKGAFFGQSYLYDSDLAEAEAEAFAYFMTGLGIELLTRASALWLLHCYEEMHKHDGYSSVLKEYGNPLIDKGYIISKINELSWATFHLPYWRLNWRPVIKEEWEKTNPNFFVYDDEEDEEDSYWG